MQTRSTTKAKSKNSSYKKGDRYLGELKNGRKYGFGTYYKKNGDRIVGEWLHNKCNGTIYTKNYIYTGSIKNNVPHGKGILSTPNYKFIGVWNKGKKYGWFTQKIIRDDTSEFQHICYYYNDNKEGVEKIMKNNQMCEEIELKNGEQDGMITYYRSDGFFFGIARKYCFTNMITYIFKNGNKIVGYYRNGKLCQYGKLYDKDGKFIKKVINNDWFK